MGNSKSSKNRALENKLRKKELFPSTSAPWQQGIIDDILSGIDFPDGAVCLDAACGVGNNIGTLLKCFGRIVAFDKSKRAVRFAKRRYEKHTDAVISFDVCDLEKTVYEDNSFDCVVCTEALEHVVNRRTVIEELFRVTKPGGYMILSSQNHFNASALVKFLFEKTHKRNWDAWGTHSHDDGYESYINCFQVKSTAKKTGFVLVKDFGADYINAWLSWIPFFYKNYKVLDQYPLLFMGKIPLIKYLGMHYFLLLRKP